MASALDGLPVPHGYDANIVLVNRNDPEGHVFVGASDPRKLATAVSELIDNPDQVGIVNRSGVRLEV